MREACLRWFAARGCARILASKLPWSGCFKRELWGIRLRTSLICFPFGMLEAWIVGNTFAHLLKFFSVRDA